MLATGGSGGADWVGLVFFGTGTIVCPSENGKGVNSYWYFGEGVAQAGLAMLNEPEPRDPTLPDAAGTDEALRVDLRRGEGGLVSQGDVTGRRE